MKPIFLQYEVHAFACASFNGSSRAIVGLARSAFAVSNITDGSWLSLRMTLALAMPRKNSMILSAGCKQATGVSSRY